MLAVTPAGMLVDKIVAKRAMLVAAMVAVIAASLVILFLPSFVVTSAAQSINAIAAAMMPPAVAATATPSMPGLVARILAGTVHVNADLGANALHRHRSAIPASTRNAAA